MIRVAVIGGGLIGRERLLAVRTLAQAGRPVMLAGIYDANVDLGRASAAEFGTMSFDTYEALLDTRPDWIFVALPHDVAIPVTEQALQTGAKVLMEKPLGRDLHEARRLCRAGRTRLSVGYNYRFFPGIRRALQDVRDGTFGRMIGVSVLLGHGGASGSETSWKLNPMRAGGGCLIDPGVHILDLFLLLSNARLEAAGGTAWTGFWNTGIEEDVHLLLSAASVTFSLHVSIAYWRSTFRMELQGTEGYGLVTGRGRSYGTQTYITGPRWGWRSAPDQAASETLVLESDGRDVFVAETDAVLFPQPGASSWPAPCSAEEALRVMELLDRCREKLALPRVYSQDH